MYEPRLAFSFDHSYFRERKIKVKDEAIGGNQHFKSFLPARVGNFLLISFQSSRILVGWEIKVKGEDDKKSIKTYQTEITPKPKRSH
jgi:hypothetical protein